NIVGFERHSDDFKRKTLLGMSYAFLKGRFWDKQANTYKDCPPSASEADTNVVSKNCQGATTDLAYLGEYMVGDFLMRDRYDVLRYYESKKVEGVAQPDGALPLSESALSSELQNNNYGLVNIAGHGNATGVYRTYWEDMNGDGTLESPNSGGEQELQGASL